MDIKKRVLEVLKSAHLISLGTIDSDGPWVADVIFLFDKDLYIYWMSDPKTRHSQAIHKNGRVAGTITASTKSKELNLGLQLEGRAERVSGQRWDLVVKHLTKRGYKIPKKAINILDGDSWYKLTPTKITLIDEKHFDFDKQELEL